MKNIIAVGLFVAVAILAVQYAQIILGTVAIAILAVVLLVWLGSLTIRCLKIIACGVLAIFILMQSALYILG